MICLSAIAVSEEEERLGLCLCEHALFEKNEVDLREVLEKEPADRRGVVGMK